MPRFALLALSLLFATTLTAETLPRGILHAPDNPAPGSPGRLIFTRDNNAPNACDVELYINQHVLASLGPGQSTSLDLPSGPLNVAVALSPAGYCAGQGPGPAQSIILAPGETRQFAVIVKPGQVFLAPMLN